MLDNWSLRRKLFVGILMGCLIPFLIGGIIINQYTTSFLYNDNIEHSEQLLKSVADNVEGQLINSESTITELIALDRRVLDSAPYLHNYTVDISAVDHKIYSEQEIDVTLYFDEIRRNNSQINYIFLSTDSGAYMESPRFMPDEKYDPRVRPWYTTAFESSSVNISEPYISKVTHDQVVSFTKKIIFANGQEGVIGLSVKLDHLFDSVESMDFTEDNYIVLLSKENVILSSPNNPDWVLKTPKELGIECLISHDQNSCGDFEGIINGQSVICHEYISDVNGWRYVAIVNKNYLLKQSSTTGKLLISIYAIAILLSSITILLVSRYISRPVIEIESAIRDMANFNLEAKRREDLLSYSQKNDEIGRIAKAVLEMYGSIEELNQNIDQMNVEIRDIDVSSDHTYQVNVSKDNHYQNIALSVNTLLLKMYDYLMQIRRFNTDILEKNELLAASEEELTAQIEQINSQKDYINYLAYHDELTDLPNRRYFLEQLQSRIDANVEGAIVLLDIDNFKAINDTMGHVFGDRILEIISKRLKQIVSNDVFISRFGGDEFLILISGYSNNDRLNRFATDLINEFKEPIIIDKMNISISLSVGITIFPKDSSDINQLLMNADLALYEVKKNGKNNYLFFEQIMTDKILFRSSTEILIQQAIEEDLFYMVYQPQVNIKTGETIAFEALLRLKDEKLSPAIFIPVSEENGSIIKIGRIVTEKVCRQLADWRNKGIKTVPIAINFSSVQLHDLDYVQFLVGCLNKYEIKSNLIEIEITESILFDENDKALKFLNDLETNGIKIAIDDFGSGYSSLNYLTSLPIYKVKLDRTLNQRILSMNETDVMESVVNLAHSMHLKVVAEGIEDYNQVRQLIISKCDVIQGYYFSRPMKADTAAESLKKKYSGVWGENLDDS